MHFYVCICYWYEDTLSEFCCLWFLLFSLLHNNGREAQYLVSGHHQNYIALWHVRNTWVRPRLWSQTAWFETCFTISCVTLGKLLTLSVAQLPRLSKENDEILVPTSWVHRVNWRNKYASLLRTTGLGVWTLCKCWPPLLTVVHTIKFHS